MGYSEISIPADGLTTVSDVLEAIDKTRTLTGTVLYAVNMQYAKVTTPVKDGDEVAFFPPVTGGSV